MSAARPPEALPEENPYVDTDTARLSQLPPSTSRPPVRKQRFFRGIGRFQLNPFDFKSCQVQPQTHQFTLTRFGDQQRIAMRSVHRFDRQHFIQPLRIATQFL